MANQLSEQFGTGFLEISSLTAVIGSSAAESLTLGNRGAPGLAWASISFSVSFPSLKLVFLLRSLVGFVIVSGCGIKQ